MEKTFDIAALGELLIDFTDAGIGESGMRLFEQNPGGAPANLLTVASHMGLKTAFIGKVGNDMHGMFLKKTLEKENICTDYLMTDPEAFTTLAFVSINENGEREFSFARKPGADTRLCREELDHGLLENSRILHVGSLSLTDEPARTATLEAVKLAKAAGAVISYDPNYRAPLWPDEATAVSTIKALIPYADVMKVSDEESLLLTGEEDIKAGAGKLLEMGPKLVAVTLGRKGVYLATEKNSGHIDGFSVKALDTTGAGDSFWGGFLSHYLTYDRKITDIVWKQWTECAMYGNATASLCVQKRGGIPAIPKMEDILAVVRAHQS